MYTGWFGRPGTVEVLVIVIILVLLFGAKRLPELARSLGKSMNEFKKGKQEGLSSESSEEVEDEAPKN